MRDRTKVLQAVAQVHATEKLDTTPITAALGDGHPTIEPTRIGRYRLKEALRLKYGDNYRNNPAAQRALSSFERDYDHIDLMRRLRGKV